MLQLFDRKFLINLCIILDLFSSLSEFQCWYCFLLIEDTWTASNDQWCLWVTTKRLLQDMCKLRITIRNMGRLAIRQFENDKTKSCEGFVNVLSFGKRRARYSCLADSFRASEVNQIYLSSLGWKVACILLLNLKYKRAMRSGGLTIHICHSDSSVFISNFEEREHFVFAADVAFGHVFDIHTLILILVNL